MDWYYSALFIAIVATGAAIWAVGFSRRWKRDACDFLKDQFGEGPDDDEIAEESRQHVAHLWLGIAAVAWFVVAALYRRA